MARQQPVSSNSQRPPRVLAVAYSCHPTEKAESRVGWARVLMAAQNHDVTVVCSSKYEPAELSRLAAEQGVAERLRFVAVSNSKLGDYCHCHDLLHVLGYRMWHRAALKVARSLHRQQPFDLVHQVNFCSYREPGYCWTLGTPFVWGPVGGTQSFPLRYLGVTDLYNGARELARNVVNGFQLRRCRRIRRVAGSEKTTLLAATQLASRHLRQMMGVEAEVELEAGLSYEPLPERQPRNPSEPLKILWTGQLRAWKGLPLLLRALALLPEDFSYELRVQGKGASEVSLKRLAKRLGIADRIRWVGWGPYPETLPHYRWSDLFVFTSLRDTSGAGLLEALAAGAPIVGLNHQGAADIMDPACARMIQPSHPGETSRRIADAILELGRDPETLCKLSRAGTRKAHRYQWSRRVSFLDRVYRQALGSADARQPVSEPSPRRTVLAQDANVGQLV